MILGEAKWDCDRPRIGSKIGSGTGSKTGSEFVLKHPSPSMPLANSPLS